MTIALHQTEDQFQGAVLDALALHGWLRAHFRPARTKQGWRTPVEGDGQGFPDLIALRGGRQLVVEFKREGRMPSIEQERWLAAFEKLAYEIDNWIEEPAQGPRVGVEVYVWAPSDWPEIERVIR